MQPLIGVTSGQTVNLQYPFSPPVQGQAHTYVDAVVHAGGAPLLIPIMKNEAALRRLYEQCDGIMLSGGNDLNPALYKQRPSPFDGEFSTHRDEQEMLLLAWALEDDKPVLGICRGMQLMNVAQGGTLYQHIPDEVAGAEIHDIAPEKKKESRIVHVLRIKEDSKFAHIVGKEDLGANAYHHQAVKDLGAGLKSTAWAEDGIVEALEFPNKTFALAVQSHPESLEEKIEPRWQKLFQAFVEASGKKA